MATPYCWPYWVATVPRQTILRIVNFSRINKITKLDAREKYMQTKLHTNCQEAISFGDRHETNLGLPK
jgi:hypothetical protein